MKRCTHSFPSKRLPNNRPILDGILGSSTARNDFPLSNVHHVHDADHKVVSCAAAFFLFVEPVDEIVAHIGAKV